MNIFWIIISIKENFNSKITESFSLSPSFFGLIFHRFIFNIQIIRFFSNYIDYWLEIGSDKNEISNKSIKIHRKMRRNIKYYLLLFKCRIKTANLLTRNQLVYRGELKTKDKTVNLKTAPCRKHFYKVYTVYIITYRHISVQFYEISVPNLK